MGLGRRVTYWPVVCLVAGVVTYWRVLCLVAGVVTYWRVLCLVAGVVIYRRVLFLVTGVHTTVENDPDDPRNIYIWSASERTQSGPQSLRLNDTASKNM